MKNLESQLITMYNAVVLFQNTKYSIEKYRNANTGNWSICVIRDKVHIEWVMTYSPGHVAYDHPYTLPKYIKDKVKKISLDLNK